MEKKRLINDINLIKTQ